MLICYQIAPEQGLKPIDEPSEIRQRCDEEGEGLVAKVSKVRLLPGPRCEKTGLRGFRPGPTQIGLYSHRR